MCLKEVRTVVLVGRPDGKIALGRPRRRWKGNIKMDFQGVRWDCSVSGYGQVANAYK
jgi:hypothetical protein